MLNRQNKWSYRFYIHKDKVQEMMSGKAIHYADGALYLTMVRYMYPNKKQSTIAVRMHQLDFGNQTFKTWRADIDLTGFENWMLSDEKEYKCLDIVESHPIFRITAQRNLPLVLADKLKKRAFIQILKRWLNYEGCIWIYDDFCEYSFGFSKYLGSFDRDNLNYNGGIIWHKDSNRYGVHT
jgi:hypothetical protein